MNPIALTFDFSVTISSEIELDLKIGKTFSKTTFFGAPTN